MRIVALTPLLLIATTALAGPPTTPGERLRDRLRARLDRACERVEEDPTPAESLNTALDTIIGGGCDHSAYDDGTCTVVTSVVVASDTMGMGVVVPEVEPLVDGTDGPLYYGEGFSLVDGADPATDSVSVWVNGKSLIVDKVLGEDLEVYGYLEFNEGKGTYDHVVEVNGVKQTFSTEIKDPTTTAGAGIDIADFETLDGGRGTTFEIELSKDEDDKGDDKGDDEKDKENDIYLMVDLVVIWTDGPED